MIYHKHNLNLKLNKFYEFKFVSQIVINCLLVNRIKENTEVPGIRDEFLDEFKSELGNIKFRNRRFYIITISAKPKEDLDKSV